MQLSLKLAEQLVSLFIMMLCGFLLARSGKVNSENSRSLSMVSLYIVTPCIVISGFFGEWTAARVHGAATSAVFTIFAMFFFMAITVPVRKIHPMPGIDVLSIVFSNVGNMVLPLIQMTLGQEYLVYASMFPPVCCAFAWTYGISLLRDPGEGTGLALTLKRIFLNPAILAVIAGILIAVLRIPVPHVVQNAVTGMASTAGPLAMIMIGILCADMPWREILSGKGMAFACFMRLVGYPLMLLAAFAAAERILGLQEQKMIMIVVMIGMAAPGAAGNVQMAQLFRKDEGRASAQHILTTLLCLITLPLVVYIAQMVL